MKIIPALLLLATFKTYLCLDIKELFETINKKTEKFNAFGSYFNWELLVNPGNPNLRFQDREYNLNEEPNWQQKYCDELAILHKSHLLNSTQARQTYLLCREPRLEPGEVGLAGKLYGNLRKIYAENEVCIPTEENISLTNLTKVEDAILKYLTSLSLLIRENILQNKFSIIEIAAKIAGRADKIGNFNICLKGEDDFQKLMFFSRNDTVLKWIWLVWREKVALMREPYRKFIDIENSSARRIGFSDLGASWRDELEVPNLREVSRRLYYSIRPLYTLLHGVVRFSLRREYGDVVPERGPIPAHLLGNLWSESWESLADLILPKTIDLSESIKKLNWTVEYMVKRAEDFYQSLGLPPMTDTFWKKSVFKRKDEKTKCHPNAADLFSKNDFRLLYCAGTTMYDFYILHHELGHIQHYMAYENQPALFRGANSALQEAIGDSIMYGVMTPQHLHRLSLINDSILNDTTFYDEIDENNNFNEEENEETINNLNNFINFHYNDDISFNGDNFNENNNFVNDEYYGDKRNFRQGLFNENHFRYNEGQSGRGKFNENNNFHFNDEGNLLKGIFDSNKQTIDNDFEDIYKITTDDILLLKQALANIPLIPFALVIDEYRWKYFEGGINTAEINEMFWKITLELQGITPPVARDEEYFDVGAKFHVPDNIPYIRYYLSSFLQHQIFESLCKAAIFGRRAVKAPLPDNIVLHRCDIYGSKAAGKVLKDIMSRGHSQTWQQILQETINQTEISALPLQQYYRPLYKLLKKLVRFYHIPIGW